MANKTTSLAIVISTVDKATAKIKAINAALEKASKPTRDLGAAFSNLGKSSGLDKIVDGFKGVGDAIGDLLGKVAMIGGVVGVAVAGLIHLVNGFDDLGKKAARLGVSVDFLAEMRDAAERTGVPVEALDDSLLAFNQNLGQARAGTGRMAKFLGLVYPPLLKQLKAAKDNAAAFDILAGVMSKLQDPAKRAALAQKTLGDSALAPLFAKGPKAIQELREHYLKLAGSQETAVKTSTETAEAMHDLHAASDQVKASIVSGLAPALTVIIGQMTEWLSGHQADIKQWAADIGERLPGAIQSIVTWLGKAFDKVSSFVDSIGGLKTVAIAVAAVLAGPLISAFASLGVALLVSPFGPVILEMAAVVAGAYAAMKALKKLEEFGRFIGEKAAFRALVAQHTDEIRAQNLEAILQGEITEEQVKAQAEALARNDIATSHAIEDANDKRAMGIIDEPAPGAPSAPDMSGAARDAFVGHLATTAQGFIQALQSPGAAQKAKITIEINGAPKGTRVNTDPSSTADVDLGVGYQMGYAQ